MPDLAEQEVSPFTSTAASLPIDRLVRDAAPDYGVDTKKMKYDLTMVAREKSAATDTAVDRQLSAQNSNYAALKEKAAAIRPLDQLKPWDADKERAQRIRDPLEAFGSYGGVFAMLASAMTRTPMDNALNAGAAAINSARANDFDGYNKAHEAHKEGLNLALKIHESERQAFKDAEELYKNDPIAGGAELKAVAAKFGAKAELAMIESGYVDQVFQIQKAKADAADKLIKTIPDLNKMDEQARVNMLSKMAIEEENKKRAGSGQPPLTAIEQADVAGNIRRKMTQSVYSFTARADEAVAIRERAAQLQKEAEARGDTLSAADAHIQAIEDVAKAKRKKSPEDEAYAKFVEEIQAKEKRDPTSQELIDFKQKYKGKNTDLGSYKGTESQAKSLTYAVAMDNGIKNISRIVDSGYFPSNKDLIAFELMEAARRSSSAPGQIVNTITRIAANNSLSSEAQQFYQGARELTAGILRRETGAAFNQGELSNTITRYIESPGDKPEIRPQKAEARRLQRDSAWLSTGLPPGMWDLNKVKTVLSTGKPAVPDGWTIEKVK